MTPSPALVQLGTPPVRVVALAHCAAIVGLEVAEDAPPPPQADLAEIPADP